MKTINTNLKVKEVTNEDLHLLETTGPNKINDDDDKESIEIDVKDSKFLNGDFGAMSTLILTAMNLNMLKLVTSDALHKNPK
jgi:hypothetical protein